MLRIAVTGGLACGKSVVGRYLAEADLAVCDADDMAHDLIARGRRAYEEIVAVFGRDILGNDGEIDRRRLGARVFSNPAELEILNRIVHPDVKKRWVKWLESRRKDGCRAAAVIVPLLYEAGEGAGWDAVVCVAASENTQIQRLLERGLSRQDIEQRIGAQMPIAEKVKLADYVIVNEGTMDLLKRQVEIVVENIMEKEK
mgnify:CR=1 FL=1